MREWEWGSKPRSEARIAGWRSEGLEAKGKEVVGEGEAPLDAVFVLCLLLCHSFYFFSFEGGWDAGGMADDH